MKMEKMHNKGQQRTSGICHFLCVPHKNRQIPPAAVAGVMSSSMKIRQIQNQDIESCAKLFSTVFSDSPWKESWSQEAAFQRLAHFYESKGFEGVVAEGDGIVGFALGNVEPFYFGDIFYLREMCVCTNLQKAGCGQKILAALEGHLASKGVHSIYLTTEKQIPAAAFYQKNGFNFKEVMGFYAKRIGS